MDSKLKDTTYSYDDMLDLMSFIYQSDEPLSSHEEVVKAWFNNRNNDKKEVQERKK
jgi:hypothetical protein